jgi:hypothetical protein
MNKDFIIFESPCPVINCENDNPNRIIRWRHAPCYNSTEFLDKNGNIICNKCFANFFILDAYFSCGDSHNEYRRPGITQLINAISVLITNPNLLEADMEFLMIVSQRILQRIKAK